MRGIAATKQTKAFYKRIELLKAKGTLKILSRLRLSVILTIGILSFFAQMNDPVHPLYVVQSLATAVLVWALFTKCRSAFVLSISIMFILGNWMKLTLHKIFEYLYIEPIGFFNGSIFEWQNYHLYSTSITLVLAISTIFWRSELSKKSISNVETKYVPFLYRAAILSTISLYSINWIFGIYRIGLGSRLELPLGLTAPISFLIFIGTPLIIALAADAHLERSKKISVRFVISISIAFVIGSISTYSRAIFITQLLPILLGMIVKARRIGKNDNNLMVIRVALPFLFAMTVALALVSTQRIVAFSDGGVVDTESVDRYYNETIGLVVERWVGAESMMVAASTDGNIKLFTQIINEEASTGVSNTYHALSNSGYSFIDGMTFLNLPGIFSILALSGSVGLVITGTLAVCIFGIQFELWVLRNFSSSETILYTSCTALSYHFVQMAFPLLMIPFVVLMVSFIYLLKIATKMGTTSRKN